MEALLLPPLLWCLVCVGFACLSDWRQLATIFTAQRPPSGRRFDFESVGVGHVAYSLCVTIHVSGKGIHLSVLFPFRLAHPPLFIPWQAIDFVDIDRAIWSGRAELKVGNPSMGKLRLRSEVIDARYREEVRPPPLPKVE
jgi:hypothetical protein